MLYAAFDNNNHHQHPRKNNPPSACSTLSAAFVGAEVWTKKLGFKVSVLPEGASAVVLEVGRMAPCGRTAVRVISNKTGESGWVILPAKLNNKAMISVLVF